PLRPPPRAPQTIDPPLPTAASVDRGRLALRAAWAASLLSLAGMLAALWLFRVEIVAAWPPAARLYLLVGGIAEG
ncbi:hypothetical protein, partial [Paracraurococcus ruber]|uniref:hypothetical protein n=1 Tax=Paracraurococcus ruber TaxID=77675 RepID=UPI001908ACEC